MKLIPIKVAFFVAFLLPFCLFSQVNLNNGLVGYFPFDSNSVDQSFTAINGVLNNAVLTPGKNNNVDSAYYFSGSNSYITCSSNNRSITNVISISVWVKTTMPNIGWVAGKYDWTVDKGYAIQIYDGHPFISGRNMSGQSTSTHYANSNVLVDDGNWHHILGVVDGNSWQIWVDCVLDTVVNSNASSPLLTNTSQFSIGYYPPGTGSFGYNYFNGSIDEVRIYNRVLTSDERSLLCDIKYVDPVLSMPIVSNDTSVCDSTVLTLSAISDTGVIYWESPLGSIVDTGTTHITTISQNTSFYVYSMLNGIYSDTSVIMVDTMNCESIVIQAPLVSSNSSVCENTSVTLFATPDTGMVYWESPVGTVIDSGNTHHANITQDVDFYVYSTLNGVSSSYSIISITVLYVDTSLTQNYFSLIANQPGVAYQWIDCENWTLILGEINQSFTPAITGFYALAVTNGICSDTSRCFYVGPVGIKEFEVSSTIRVYPNPVHDELRVQSLTNVLIQSIEIVGVSGKTVYSIKNLSAGLFVIDFKNYASGVYFIKAQTQEETSVVKVVKP